MRIGTLLALAVLLFCGCGSASKNGSPKESLSKFLQAMENKDFEEAKKYVTDDSKNFLNQLENSNDDAADIYDDKKFDVKEEKITGDDAKVMVQANTGAELSFNLKYQHDAWKVSFNMAAIMQMVTDAIKKEGIDINKDINDALKNIKEEPDSSDEDTDSTK